MKQKRIVLAYGEVTGHAHAFYDADVELLANKELRINERADLKHEEHTKHMFEPGLGDVIRQREYHMGSLRRAAD